MPDSPLDRLFRLERRGYLWGLRGIRALLEWCGRPERRYATVLVGGTNGKGSTAAALERMLREAGYRTALYTSPHLVRFEERLRVRGRGVDLACPRIDAIPQAEEVDVVPVAVPRITTRSASATRSSIVA